MNRHDLYIVIKAHTQIKSCRLELHNYVISYYFHHIPGRDLINIGFVTSDIERVKKASKTTPKITPIIKHLIRPVVET